MVDPELAIDRINKVFGAHPGHRALHAKGHFYAGTFTATAEAKALSRAGHLQGDPVPVRVRWSNGGGDPTVPDKAPDVRGMAVSFRLADGTATDLLGQTAPRFPVRTPEDFVAFVEASKNPVNLPLFLLRHRSALPAMVANVKGKAIVPPRSYAEATFYPVHAYRWVAADGTQTWVRYRLDPLPGTAPAGTFEGADRLQEEIVARLATAPVRYDLRVVVAAPGDDPHDPMSVWKGSRELSAGVIEVIAPDPDREQNGEVVVFDPTRVVDGIELSDDPILRYRAGAYSASVSRRV
ncbi:MAG: catalase family peroxidase [Microbacterium sp.]|nr:MAG: catalase family peroxidase [Microbacterium sp.]